MAEPVPGRCTRRRLLRAGGLAATLGLAGCGGISTYTFSAAPVGLPAAARERLGYVERRAGAYTYEERMTVGGQDITATFEGHLAVYDGAATATATGPTTNGAATGEGTVGAETATGSSAGSEARAGSRERAAGVLPAVAVVSTPAGDVADRTLNPLASAPLESALAGERLRGVLSDVGVGSRNRPVWRRGPEAVGVTESSLLGRETTVSAFAGIVGTGDDPRFVLVAFSRLAGEDVVFSIGAWGRSVASTSRVFVGDDGYATRREVDAGLDAMASVNGGFVVG